MARIDTLENFLTDIATAIKNKKRTTNTMLAANFDAEIDSIPTGTVLETAVVEASEIIEEETVVKINSAPIEEPVVIPKSGITEVVIEKPVLADTIGLTCDKIVNGHSILGVDGTADILDTSDATARPEELLLNKTAYVRGQKITGTAEDIRDNHVEAGIFDIRNDEELGVIHTSSAYPPTSDTALMNANTFYEVNIQHNVIANAIGLTADKLVKGNTILGIEGNAIMGSENSAMVFPSVEEMNASTGTNGAIALIYEPITVPWDGASTIPANTVITFPLSITFDSPIDGEYIFTLSDTANNTQNYLTMDFGRGIMSEPDGGAYDVFFCNISYVKNGNAQYLNSYESTNGYVWTRMEVDTLIFDTDLSVISGDVTHTCTAIHMPGYNPNGIYTHNGTSWVKVATTPTVEEYDEALTTADDILGY